MKSNLQNISDYDINPLLIQRELNNRSLYEFLKYFWDAISDEEYADNWHIQYLCDEVQEVAEKVANKEKGTGDLLINIPPGTTKTTIVLRMFPAWCWTRWHWMKFITASYSQTLSLESAEDCRDLIRSDKFQIMYPELQIKEDKDTKSNYRVIKKIDNKLHPGGNRFSTSVGGTAIGFHCHIFIWDDPLNPNHEASEAILRSTNNWIDKVPSTRKVDKEVSVTIGIMQRLAENDPSGHLLAKKKKKIKHICLPGELESYENMVKPSNLQQYYRDGLLDPLRLNRIALNELFTDLGQYGYAGQVGQKPTPPGGGMFKVDNLQVIQTLPAADFIAHIVRYWDKAGTTGGGAYTAGVQIAKLRDGRFVVCDVARGQWGTDVREKKILQTSQADVLIQEKGSKTIPYDIYVEQEPGSGGKESAEMTVRRLAGFNVYRDLPKGDKAKRADPFSVQVNEGNVLILRGEWNHEFTKELENFPFSKYKDQVDAASGAFSKLVKKRIAKSY